MNLQHDKNLKVIDLEVTPKTSSKSNLTRTLALLLVLFVVPLLAATYWMYVQAVRELENAELQNDLVRARTVAALVDREFSSAENALVSIADRPMFQESWAKRDLSAVDLNLQEAHKLEPSFLFTSVYELDGTLRAITPADSIVGQNYSYRDWYRGVTANWQPYVSEVYRTAAEGNPLVVAISVPVRDEKGKPTGILMAPYALDQLTRKFNELEAGSSGELFVFDQRGVIAAAPSINPMAEPIRSSQQEVVSLALAGKEGSSRFRYGTGDNFVAYAPVSKLGWAVVYRRPAQLALEAALRLRQRTFSTSFYLLLIYLTTAGLAALLVRRQDKLVIANQKLNLELEGRITESTRAREELDRFFTVSIEMLCILGFDDRFKRVNPAWEKTLGYATEELLATPYTDFIHAEDRESAIREADKLRAGGEMIAFENRCRCKDGSYKWLQWSATSLPGQQVIYAGARDVTERKRAEEALKWAKEEAERVSKFKDQFLSTMSHELRTPLNAILGFSDLLPDERYGPLNERQRRYVTHIHTSGKHLLRLINDILDLSKIEAGRLELAIENVPVERSLREVLDVVRPLAEKKSQSLSYEAESKLAVRADSTRLRQVLINLAGNAIKFTPDGGKIKLCGRLVDGKVRFEVLDDGPGIPPEEKKRIFEAFYRLRRSGNAQEGTGLGLAITQRLVELHGAELALESEAGQGSCFYFSLPFVAVLADVPSRTTGSAKREGESARIFVIEDDPAAAQLIQSQLAAVGYEPFVCEDLSSAVEIAAELLPDAITLDLVMKPTNGWELLLQLKNEPRTANIPVVVVSIVDQPALGTTLGADEYLIKPVEQSALCAAIERCLAARDGLKLARPVLVVEDDGPTREVISEMLTTQGYNIATAADGAQARTWMSASLPALVILDLMLPNVSGFELLSEWRNSVRTADLPVFVLTSKDLTQEEEKYLRAHAESLWRKQESWQIALTRELKRVLAANQTVRG
jgi:PAS domain S-box-containing protein